MSERIIFHVDVNSAYLSWEAVENLKNGGTEDYRTMLAAVGGDIEHRHGIILAKSIPTKPYGVTTGEPVVHALKKCPNLILLKPHHEIYHRYSKALMNILNQYSDKIEQFSVDEAFMDMTGTQLLFGPPVEAANRIREQIYEELGFTVNVGISSNKLLAKMASDFSKPNKTHTLFKEEIPTKMWPLPVGDLFFVGKNTAQKLYSIGIRTIGDLAHSDEAMLTDVLKKQGSSIWRSANGIDDSEVISESEKPKGYSNETTISFDVTESDIAKKILRELTEKVCMRIRNDNAKCECVSIHFRFNDLSRASKQCTLPAASNISDEIFNYVCNLFDEKWDGTPIRLLGVQLSNIVYGNSYRQMSLFDTSDYEKLEKLDYALDSINKKYGNGTITRASSFKTKSPDNSFENTK